MTPGGREQIDRLLARSHRLGSDRRFTNYAGGNTSAKVTLPDPVTGSPVRVLAVKGSGGDLGTLTESGLAYLVLDRVVGLERLHASGVARGRPRRATTPTAGSATVVRCRRSTLRSTRSSTRPTSTTSTPTR